MARPRKNVPAPDLGPGQASYVLDRVIAEQRVSLGDVQRYISDMHRQIAVLEGRLQSLREAAGAPDNVRRIESRQWRSGSHDGPTRTAYGFSPQARAPGRQRNDGGCCKLAFGVHGEAPKEAPRIHCHSCRPRLPRVARSDLSLLNKMPKVKRGYYTKVAKKQGREATIKT
jgi:hypothetical protein